VKKATLTGHIKSQCSAILAGVVEGRVEPKTARLALKAAEVIARLHETEAQYRVAMLNMGQQVEKMGNQPIGAIDEDPEITSLAAKA